MDNMIFTSEVCGVVLIAPFDKISRPPCSTIRFIVFLSLFFRCFSPFSLYHRTFSLTVAFIIAKIDKVCVKFSFLTETLTLLRYDEGRKSERVMQNELRKKGRGADRAADNRNYHAVFRCLAGRGGDGAEQSNQTMSGVCGHWVKSFQAFRRPCPASGAGFRRVRRC